MTILDIELFLLDVKIGVNRIIIAKEINAPLEIV